MRGDGKERTTEPSIDEGQERHEDEEKEYKGKETLQDMTERPYGRHDNSK